MMRSKKFSGSLLIILLLTTGLLLISCGGSDDTREPSPTLSDELNIYSRFGFLDPAIIEQFEAEFGIKVNLDIYQDEDFMLSVIQSDPSAYDLIFPTESLVAQMISMKLLSPLEAGSIPNLSNIDPEYLNMGYDPGNTYSAPLLVGTTGIAFNSDYVTESVNSWGVLWDDGYSGRVSMLDKARKAIGATLKYLGYPLNTRESAAYDAVRERMLTQIPLLAGFLDTEQTINSLRSGEVWLAQLANGDAFTLKKEMPEIEFVIPGEGSDYYIGCVAVPGKAPNKYTAEVFIDFLLRPEIHAQNSNYNHYACPNKAALDSGMIEADILADPGIYLPPRTKIKLDSWDIVSGPVNSLYNKIWSELKSLPSES